MVRKKFKFTSYEAAKHELNRLTDWEISILFRDLDVIKEQISVLDTLIDWESEEKASNDPMQSKYKIEMYNYLQAAEHILIVFEEKQMFEEAGKLTKWLPELKYI